MAEVVEQKTIEALEIYNVNQSKAFIKGGLDSAPRRSQLLTLVDL